MSRRDRRAILLGVTVVTLTWGALRGVPSLLSAVRQREEAVVQKVDLMRRANERLAGLERMDDSIGVLERAVGAVPRFVLTGEDLETASIDLMRRARQHLSDPHVVLTGFGAYSTGERLGDLELARLTVTIESDFTGVVEAADRFEADSALGVESLEVAASEPFDTPDDMERLRATMVVSGWFRPGSGRPDVSSPLAAR